MGERAWRVATTGGFLLFVAASITALVAQTDGPDPAEGSPEENGTLSGQVSQVQEVPLLARFRERDPSWADSVGRLLPRRLDDAAGDQIDRYFLYLPPGFEPAKRDWPVLLYLHGRSLRGSDLDLVKRYGIPSLVERGYQIPFVVVAPQLPAGRVWSDADELWSLIEESVLDRYPVDEDRVYVTGFSLGAGGAWVLAREYAEELAGVVPISGSAPPLSDEWAGYLGDVPILVYHGDADELVPYAPAAEAVRFYDERDVTIDLRTVEGGRHGIVQDVYRDPALYRWLLAQRR